MAMACASMGASQLALAQLLPDKHITSVGNWTISTAVYGVGCVAHLATENATLSISGETKDNLVVLVEVGGDRFDTLLDGSNEDISGIEIALARERWGDVEPYGFRGTLGVILHIGTDFLDHLKASQRLKVTERGSQKLSIPLDDPTAVIDALFACFDEQ